MERFARSGSAGDHACGCSKRTQNANSVSYHERDAFPVVRKCSVMKWTKTEPARSPERWPSAPMSRSMYSGGSTNSDGIGT